MGKIHGAPRDDLVPARSEHAPQAFGKEHERSREVDMFEHAASSGGDARIEIAAVGQRWHQNAVKLIRVGDGPNRDPHVVQDSVERDEVKRVPPTTADRRAVDSSATVAVRQVETGVKLVRVLPSCRGVNTRREPSYDSSRCSRNFSDT